MPDPIKFVDQKIEQTKMMKDMKNWQRKIEIAEVAAKKAKATIRLHEHELQGMDGYE